MLSKAKTAQLPSLPAGASFDEVRQRLDEAGAVVLRDVLPREQLARINADLAPWFEQALTGEGLLFGRRTKRFSAIFAKAASTACLALHEITLRLAEEVLTAPQNGVPMCERIQLNLTQAIAIGPGEPAQMIHRDEDLFPLPVGTERMINVMWTLDDFTAENGATQIVPGSNHWPRDRMPAPGEALPAIAPAGSAIVWLGSTLHGGGANCSDATRRGVVVSYNFGWLAQAEKLLLSIPPEVARQLPERLQELIGYQVHRPNVGWVEGRDPKEWLHGAFGALAHCADNLPPQFEAFLEAALRANAGPDAP
jgi:ectoine hydroxylase-related dioxygenase (phytanoyl-CoA dioxygenase family)